MDMVMGPGLGEQLEQAIKTLNNQQIMVLPPFPESPNPRSSPLTPRLSPFTSHPSTLTQHPPTLTPTPPPSHLLS